MTRKCGVPQLLKWHAFENCQEQESQALTGNEESQNVFAVMIDWLIGGISVREDGVIKRYHRHFHARNNQDIQDLVDLCSLQVIVESNL